METVNREISMPSQTRYEQLLAEPAYQLHCPCGNISLAHKGFITVNATFHQVCTSDFVNETWIQLVPPGNTWFSYDRSDVYVGRDSYYSLLSRLCALSQTTINQNADDFLSQVFVNAQAMSELDFLSQLGVITQHFKNSTSARFAHALHLLRDMSQANAFISGFFFNWYWSLQNEQTSATIPAYPVIMKNQCSCATRSDCFEPGGIYSGPNGTQLYAVPGLNVGCSTVETLLRSTFDCLYDQRCIERIVSYFSNYPAPLNGSINFMPMNSTKPSRFSTHTAIGEMVNALFIEQWQINVSYAAFYSQCAPISCSYRVQERNNFLYIISRLLGTYGGLTVSLRFIVPYIVKLSFLARKRICMNAVDPVP